jgi:8-oxo-dGTP diphosphatase
LDEVKKRLRVRVAAIIQKEDSLLMVRHRKGEDSYWLLPGGGVKYGETLSEALECELKEEACVYISVGNWAFVTDAISPNDDRQLIQLSFMATIMAGEVALGIDESVLEVKFVSVDELVSLRVHPPINDGLLNGLLNGFALEQNYLGNRWL